MSDNIPDYNFHDTNRWLDAQNNWEVMKFSARIFSDALADLVVEPAKLMMPKTFAQWTGRIWAVLATYVFMVIAGNLLEVAAPLIGTLLISALITIAGLGLVAQRLPRARTFFTDLVYWWRMR